MSQITRDCLNSDVIEQLHKYRSKDDTEVAYESMAIEELDIDDFYDERRCATEVDEDEDDSAAAK